MAWFQVYPLMRSLKRSATCLLLLALFVTEPRYNCRQPCCAPVQQSSRMKKTPFSLLCAVKLICNFLLNFCTPLADDCCHCTDYTYATTPPFGLKCKQLETLYQVWLTFTLAGHDGSTFGAVAIRDLGMQGSSSEHDINVSTSHVVDLQAITLP